LPSTPLHLDCWLEFLGAVHSEYCQHHQHQHVPRRVRVPVPRVAPRAPCGAITASTVEDFVDRHARCARLHAAATAVPGRRHRPHVGQPTPGLVARDGRLVLPDVPEQDVRAPPQLAADVLLRTCPAPLDRRPAPAVPVAVADDAVSAAGRGVGVRGAKPDPVNCKRSSTILPNTCNDPSKAIYGVPKTP